MLKNLDGGPREGFKYAGVLLVTGMAYYAPTVDLFLPIPFLLALSHSNVLHSLNVRVLLNFVPIPILSVHSQLHLHLLSHSDSHPLTKTLAHPITTSG